MNKEYIKVKSFQDILNAGFTTTGDDRNIINLIDMFNKGKVCKLYPKHYCIVENDINDLKCLSTVINIK